MSSTQNKKNITIRELCTDVANFFEATPIHIFTKSPLEPKLESHKKAAGKNVVLLVSNGIDNITENKSQTILEPSNFRILNQYNLVDSEVTKLGHDRSHLLYPDIVHFINKKENQELPPHSQAHLLSPKNFQSDQAMLDEIQNIIQQKKEPQFVTALMNSSFLTQTGKFNQHIEPIAQLIENLNTTGTIYLLTSTNELSQESQKQATPNSFRTHIRPIVPLLVVAELLRNYKKLERKNPVEWRRYNNKQIDFSCLYRPTNFR